jgi:hypothetical protein
VTTSTPRLFPGDPAPRFMAASSVQPHHQFDLQAGRYIVLSFVDRARAAEPGVLEAMAQLPRRHALSVRHWFVLAEAPDAGRVDALTVDGAPRWFLDPAGTLAELYDVPADAGITSFLINPRFQLMGTLRLPDVAAQLAQIDAALRAQLPMEDLPRMGGTAPVLIIPHVFEPELCQLLIEGYERNGGHTSYFMREVEGRTVPRLDSGFKVRRDWVIEDQRLCAQIGARFTRRVVPEIQRAFNFTVDHLERQLVACYAAEEGGHFAAHRDNTARGTAHRRFACSLNLNADYDGGDLIFPEFGMQQYRPAPGACVIFSAALLHQANKVTRGKRYAYLPFLHDNAAQKIFEANASLIDAPPVHA